MYTCYTKLVLLLLFVVTFPNNVHSNVVRDSGEMYNFKCDSYKGSLEEFYKKYTFVAVLYSSQTTSVDGEHYSHLEVIRSVKGGGLSGRKLYMALKGKNKLLNLGMNSVYGFESVDVSGKVTLKKNDCSNKFSLQEIDELIKKKKKEKITPLKVALEMGDFKKVEKLITKDGVKNVEGDIDLGILWSLYYYEKPKLIKKFVEIVDPNYVYKKNHKTMLHYTSSWRDLDLAKYLVSKGADVNALDESGLNPAFYAMYNKSFELFKFLIDKGSLIKGDKLGKIPQPYYIIFGNSRRPESPKVVEDYRKILQLLIDKGIKFDQESLSGSRYPSPVIQCSKEKSLHCVEVLIENGFKPSESALKNNIYSLDGPMRRLLIKNGYLKIGDEKYYKEVKELRTISSHEIKNTQKRIQNIILSAIDRGDLEVVRSLAKKVKTLDYTAKVSSLFSGTSRYKKCPLSLSIGDHAMTKLLIENGASLNFSCEGSFKKSNFFESIVKSCDYKTLEYLKYIDLEKELRTMIGTKTIESVIGKVDNVTALGLYQCNNTLRELVKIDIYPRSLKSYVLSLGSKSLSTAKVIFQDSDMIPQTVLSELENTVMGKGRRSYDSTYKVGSPEMIDSYNTIKRLYLKDSKEDKVSLDASEIPIFEINKEYPLCGRYGPVKSFKTVKLIESDLELPFCLHLEGGYDWNNYKVFKVIENKGNLLKLRYFVSNEHHIPLSKREEKEVWINKTYVVSPLVLKSEGVATIPLTKISHSKLSIVNGMIQEKGSTELCQYRKDIKIENKPISSSGFEVLSIPEGVKENTLKLKSYIDFSFSRGCGT